MFPIPRCSLLNEEICQLQEEVAQLKHQLGSLEEEESLVVSELKDELADVRRQLEEANERHKLDKKQAEKAAQVCLFEL